MSESLLISHSCSIFLICFFASFKLALYFPNSLCRMPFLWTGHVQLYWTATGTHTCTCTLYVQCTCTCTCNISTIANTRHKCHAFLMMTYFSCIAFKFICRLSLSLLVFSISLWRERCTCVKWLCKHMYMYSMTVLVLYLWHLSYGVFFKLHYL